ncbi:hypothetical protein [Candidatus Regiella insecticola]|uniref:hypothetical protein n=1 Tax=Candidatus Regiella insecticola TaxID=138073 RepID=UPI0012FE97A4|nr:hypothetical protein [Candidatus Regiella insecticola]
MNDRCQRHRNLKGEGYYSIFRNRSSLCEVKAPDAQQPLLTQYMRIARTGQRRIRVTQ